MAKPSKKPKRGPKQKVKPRAKAKRKRLVIKTPQSAHVFESGALETIASLIAAARGAEVVLRSEIGRLAAFYSQRLTATAVDDKWLKPLESTKFYRIVFGKFDPLDVAGTLSCGGRLNVGGAQDSDDYGATGRMKAGLYMALSPKTAIAEAGLPAEAKPRIYEIELIDPTAPLVFDLDLVAADLETLTPLPNGVRVTLLETPTAARWSLVKVPCVSQLIGQWLRGSGKAAGILYPSVRDPGGQNVFVFLDSTAAAKAMFRATLVQS